MGRGKNITPQQKEMIRELRKKGHTQPEIQEILGVSSWTVSTTLRENVLVSRERYEKLLEIEKWFEKKMKEGGGD